MPSNTNYMIYEFQHFRAEGHPLPQQGQDCAMMRLRLSEAYTWESIPCFEPKAVAAVCEYKLNASSDVGYNNGMYIF